MSTGGSRAVLSTGCAIQSFFFVINEIHRSSGKDRGCRPRSVKKTDRQSDLFFEPARRSGTGEKIQVGFGPGIEDRDEHGHLSSLVGLALHRDLSAQFLNVLEAFVRPDAHAGWLGRLEGLEEPVANKLGGHALTRVADLDARLPTQSVDAEPDLAGRIGRIERVLNDVSDDSFQAFFVTS